MKSEVLIVILKKLMMINEKVKDNMFVHKKKKKKTRTMQKYLTRHLKSLITEHTFFLFSFITKIKVLWIFMSVCATSILFYA